MTENTYFLVFLIDFKTGSFTESFRRFISTIRRLIVFINQNFTTFKTNTTENFQYPQAGFNFLLGLTIRL